MLDRGPTACLLLHGFSGSPAEIRALGEYLAAQGITVRAPLLPGHGTDREALRKSRWPHWVRAAEAELAELEPRYGKVHVAGFSMGGLIALYLAARHEVATVTTLACPAKLADWRHLEALLSRVTQAEGGFPVDAARSLVRLASRVRRELPRVQAPLLALEGEHDHWIAAGSAEYLVQGVGSHEKRQVLLPGRRHFITLERGREEVFRVVHGWVMQYM